MTSLLKTPTAASCRRMARVYRASAAQYRAAARGIPARDTQMASLLIMRAAACDSTAAAWDLKEDNAAVSIKPRVYTRPPAMPAAPAPDRSYLGLLAIGAFCALAGAFIYWGTM